MHYTEGIIFCATGFIVSVLLVFGRMNSALQAMRSGDISGSDTGFLALLKIPIVYTVLAVARFQSLTRVSRVI